MIDNNNPHTIYHVAYTVSYYKDLTPVGTKDEWNRAVFQHAGGFGGEYEVTSTVKYDRLKSLLESVYNAGISKAKSNIRQALGIRDF